MPEEGFLRRWARVKASGGEAVAEAPPPAAAPAATPAVEPAPAALPVARAQAPAAQSALTIDDAARLTPASDFSAFVSQGVDKDVRRLALKKLFADPHFNVMDRLDMYMDDYNKPDPVSAAMLAGLEHARSALRRPEEVQAELARLAALDGPGQAPGAPALPAPAPAGETPMAEAAQPLAAIEDGPDVDLPACDGALPQAQVCAGDPTAARAVERPLPSLDPGAGAHDKDAIALTIVRAHNGEDGPDGRTAGRSPFALFPR